MGKVNVWNNIVRFVKREVFGGGSDGASYSPRTGAPVYDEVLTTPMAVATVFRCVRLLSDSVANLPLLYMRRKGSIFVEDTDSRLHYLLTIQPNGMTNAFDFWSRAIQNMLLEGNAYIVPVYDYDKMEVSRLVLCERGTVAHDIITDTYTVHDPYNGISGKFDEYSMIHIIGQTGRSAKHGLSVLSYARQATAIAGSGDAETRRRFANGGNMRAFVSNDKSLRGFNEVTDRQIDRFAESLDEKLNTNARFIGLHGQVQVQPYTLSSSDMQFLESRKFTVREICRFFGVHPSFVFDDTSNNYKSAEMANVAFMSNTLNPLLRRIEVELHRKLIPSALCCSRRFQFDRRGLYACDLDSKMKFYQMLLATGTHTVNDLRSVENMNPVEGGDRVLVSANLRALDEVTTDVQENMKENKNDKENGKGSDE